MPKGLMKETVKMLEYGLELVNSVPYKVSLRWVFYRLFQAGFYLAKNDYENKFKDKMSNARKQFLYGWAPDTLADDTREIIYRTGGFSTIAECISDLIPNIIKEITFEIDHFYHQERYVEIWFEARAMSQQFLHYTDEINLVPFGGDPSIPLKWSVAKHLENVKVIYDKPILILYFGDCDVKGDQIPASALKDIKAWSKFPFEYKPCGLTEEQVERINKKKPEEKKIPENPDKPGQYQWEALEDEDAAEIIQTAVANYVDLELMKEKRMEAEKESDIWRAKIEKALNKMKP